MSEKPEMVTWEQAVVWLRNHDKYCDLVYLSYLDDPLLNAALRFWQSEEWAAVRSILLYSESRSLPSSCKVLDIGAGRGIASYAFARDGWNVTALEPDPSDVVGADAIRNLSKISGLRINVVDTVAEALPFNDNYFDLVYSRQVFHHIADMSRACSEAFRVLRPGGRLLITREHVIDSLDDLPVFLSAHVTHQLCGGETARLEAEYVSAIKGSGLRLLKVWGSFGSVINYYPVSRSDRLAVCVKPLLPWFGWRLSMALVSEHYFGGRWLLERLAKRASTADSHPGRLFSFLAEKRV